MAITFAHACQTLLTGNTLKWDGFRDQKGGALRLDEPAQRRLLAYLLGQNSAKVAQASENLFNGLISEWNDTEHDPAATTAPGVAGANADVWRLHRIEASSFGGLTLFGGVPFDFCVDGENWCLLGQNGSGKTSLASVIVWALTGKRICEQDGPIDEKGLREPVTNAEGKEIGEWPPFASYPETAADLVKPIEVWARLTFKSQNGDSASAYRRITCPLTGTPAIDSKIDPRLLAQPQLIDTGILMPARLARIGFGAKSQSLYEAVKVLTGLDQLADIAEGCANLTHNGRRFLKYGKENGIDGLKQRFDENIARAKAKAHELNFAMPVEDVVDHPNIVKALKDAAASASTEAGTHLVTLASEIGTGIDTTTPQGRATVRAAVSTARGVVSQKTNGIAVFSAWTALADAATSESFSNLPQAIQAARTELEIALKWHAVQIQDNKFRLKALAAQFFVTPHQHDDEALCPVCESTLTSAAQKALAEELKRLKKDSTQAERKLEDVCRALEHSLTSFLTQDLRRQQGLLSDMNPRDAYREAVRERFCAAAPFEDVLTGLAASIEVTVTQQYAVLPNFQHHGLVEPDEPEAAKALRRHMHAMERMLSLVAWWAGNRKQFRDAWAALVGRKREDGSFPAGSIEAQLATLEDALQKADPLDELSKHLLAAAAAAESWAPVNAGQKSREAIAEALSPLKDLRTLVAAETARAIDGLSGRMKVILERIHHRERLAYEQTALDKKAITVEGSFARGMHIDAALVANTSWLRAILWAFVLALRDQTVHELGCNPFPLVVLDDPQTTFDPRNKVKWAGEIAGLANLPVNDKGGIQLFLTTHERQFYQCMVDHQKLKGEQGLIGGVNRASGVAKIINGGCLERVYREAVENNDDARAREYIRDIRIYSEDLLKFMLRGEGAQIPSMSLGDLKEELRRLKTAHTPPFDRPPFLRLFNTLDGGGGKAMKLINSSHHMNDETLGLAAATDVKKFWEERLRSEIEDAFELYDTYESFYGEPRTFPWAKNGLPFPNGFRDQIKSVKLQRTGIAAAARTDGLAGDGLVTVEEWEVQKPVILPNHGVFQLAAGTLDPVAGIGDLLIVSNYAPVHRRNLVVVCSGNSLLARRFNGVEAHPEIAVLTGQAVDPTVVAEPVIVAAKPADCRKIIGTLFTSHRLTPPPMDPKREIVPLADPAIIAAFLDGAKLFQVKGRSAEPIALDGQFLITRQVTTDLVAVKSLDGRLIVAIDDAGTRYFKRLRCREPLMVLESLNPDGTTAAELLSANGELGLPKLTHALEVVGVLFELPN